MLLLDTALYLVVTVPAPGLPVSEYLAQHQVIKSVARLVYKQVTENRGARQRQVTETLEHLVARKLIVVTQAPFVEFDAIVY